MTYETLAAIQTTPTHVDDDDTCNTCNYRKYTLKPDENKKHMKISKKYKVHRS